MADRDVSADESVLLHGADQRLYDLFRTARLAFKGDLSLITAAADAQMPRALASIPVRRWMRPFLIRLSNEESAKRILFLQKTSGVRRNIVKGKAMTDQALDLLYAEQNLRSGG